MSDVVVQGHWDEHVAWSRAADLLKKRRSRARNAALLLTIAGAILQTVAATYSTYATIRVTVGLAGAVALTLVPLLGIYFLKPEETRKWLRARSISEGIKSEIYTYRAGAAPYDQPDSIHLLSDKVREIRDWGKDIALERARIGNVSEPAPQRLDPEAYLAARANEQITTYYEPKANRYTEMSERFRHLEISLAVAAAVLGTAATLLATDWGAWVAVLTTIGGSITAYAAASRYDFQATTFYATARQLKDLIEDWHGGRKTWSEFVRGCEEAISAENRGWMAKLDEKTDTAAG